MPALASRADSGRPRIAVVRALIRLARPKQWLKNAYLFAALVFAGEAHNPGLLLQACLGFVYFCLASSSVYVLNDLVDAERDKLHPKKRLRPIPSGAVSRPAAVVYLLVLLAVWLPGSYLLSPRFCLTAVLYLLLNVAYSWRLKHMFLLDVLTIAAGFILRAQAGALLVGVPLSPWLLVCTILLSLFLGLGKRRSELGTARAGHREVLAIYTPELLDQYLSALTGTTIMAYSLYTITANPRHEMMATIPFVIYGLFRYLYLIQRTDLAGAPEEALVTDRPMLINLVLWVLCTGYILYR